MTQILNWQWDAVAIPYWRELVHYGSNLGIDRICIELHGQQLAYNTETLLKLRASRPELRAAATEHLVETDQQFVYRRGKTVVVLNNATTPAEITIPLASLGNAISSP